MGEPRRRLALIRADVPSLTPFVGELLTAPLLDRRPNGARCSSAGAPPRCCCLNMCMPNPATAAGDGRPDESVSAGGSADRLSRVARPSAAVSGVSQYSTSRGGSGGLQNIAPILALIGGRLKQRACPYYQLFDALLALAKSPLTSDSVQNRWREKSATIPVRRWTPFGKKSR